MADGGSHFSGTGKRVEKDVALGSKQQHQFTNKKKETPEKDEKSK
ncbi:MULTISPECIES: hypothetical protein [Methanosarcina]|nr:MULTISPECIES: hypothetical protein [Methanosarcina]